MTGRMAPKLRGVVTERMTVIYDGGCRACGRMIALLGRWDRRGRFELLPYQDAAVAVRFPSITTAELREALQLVGPSGERWSGAAAVERIVAELPGGSPIGRLLRIPLIGALADRLYRWFARHRYRFGCAHCRRTG